MAIDTAAERRASAAFGVPIQGVGVTPQGSPDALHRSAQAWGFNSTTGGGAAGYGSAAVTVNTRAQINQRPGTMPLGGM